MNIDNFKKILFIKLFFVTAFLCFFGFINTVQAADAVSGDFVSWHDYQGPVDYGNVTWEHVTAAGTAIVMKVRSSNNSDMTGATDWATCVAVTSGADISANACVTDGHRYLQYQATLSADDSAVAIPEIYNIQIQLENKVDNIVSSPMDSAATDNVVNSLSWEETLNGGSDIRFQIRTSADNTTWTEWMGTDGTNLTYFTDSAGTESMPTAFTDGADDRYIQYQLFLVSDGVDKAYVWNIDLKYDELDPIIANVSPTETDIRESTISLTIPGSDFVAGATVQLINGTDTYTATNVVVTPTQITCNFAIISAMVDIWDLKITNTNQAFDILEDSFTIRNIVNFTSWKDLGVETDFSQMTWSQEVFDETGVELRARSAASFDMSDAAAWDTCDILTNGQDLSENNCVTDGGKYLEYQATLFTSEKNTSPSFYNLSVGFEKFDEFISSPYNSDDFANLVAAISWTEETPANTDIRFQIRTSADGTTWTDWCGPDDGVEGSCDTTTYFTSSDGSDDIDDLHRDGTDDQWMQYKTIFYTSGSNKPTVADMTLTYVVNAIPQVQNMTATPDTEGHVNITYEVRDIDTTMAGNNTPNEVSPTFEFWNGTAWAPCVSMEVGDTANKTVEEVDFIAYSATWTPANDFPDHFMNDTAKVRVVIDDNEAANNIKMLESAEFILDTTAPALGTFPILVDAKSIPSVLTLDITDDSAYYMKISLEDDLADADWQVYDDASAIELTTDPDTVYVQFKDEYGNHTAIQNIETPMTPVYVMVQDTTNVLEEPNTYRLFVAWRVVDDPPAGFASYLVYRSDDGTNYTLVETINDRTINYYSDESPEQNKITYYKIAVVDNDDNYSYFSEVIEGKANGVEDAGEGGGGVSTTAPVISNVESDPFYTTQATIAWDTDTLSNSTVAYSGDAGVFVSETGLATMVDNAGSVGAHSVTLTGLDPDTDYYYKVQSIDANGNIASSTPNADGYTFHTLAGPVISDISTPAITNTGFTVTWETDINSDSYVVYSLNSNMSGFEQIGSSDEVQDHSVEVNDLIPGEAYYFYVKSGVALDDNAASNYTVITNQDTTPPNITFDIDDDVRIISDSVVEIEWLTNEHATSSIRYGTTTDYFLFQENLNFNKDHKYKLEDLEIGTEYRFQLISTDVNNNERKEDDGGVGYLFETIDSTDYEAPEITSVEASLVTDEKALIQWNTDEISDSLVEYGLESGNYTLSTDRSALTTNHSIRLNSLSFKTNYFYRVISKDANFNTSTSTEYTFTTLEELSEASEVEEAVEEAKEAAEAEAGGGGVLIIDKRDKIAPSISSLEVVNIGADTVELIWKTNELASGLVEYGLEGKFGNIYGIDMASSNDHSVKLKWLTPETEYNFKALSTDSSGNIKYSNIDTFTTISKAAEIEQELERELTFEEVEELAGEDTRTQEEILEAASNKALEIIKNAADKVSLASLEKNLQNQYDSLEELADIIPGPMLSGEPKVITTANSATIAWKTDKDSNSLVALASEEMYDTSRENPYAQVSGNMDEKTTQHVVSLYDLEPNTTYHYQVRSKSTVGPRSESPDFIFTTAREILDITNYAAEKVDSEIAIFKWVTNIESDSQIRVTPYRNNILSVDESIVRDNKSQSVIHEIEVDSLEAGVVYDVELVSKSQDGNLATKKIEAFATSEDDLPPLVYQVQTDSALSPGKDVRVQTIISWKTNEPATTRVFYEQGVGGTEEELTEKTKLETNYTKKHVVVLTKFDPGTVYRFRVESIDSGGNTSLSKVYTVLTPRQSESVFQVIMKNMEGMFGWVGNIKK